MSNQTIKNIVVFGGNGFLGKRICQLALNDGLKVTSISGSGKKPSPYLREDCQWMDSVEWKRGNIFKPSTYQDLLKDADIVVSTIGILLENDQYKNVVSSGDGVIGAVQGLFKSAANSNPMQRTPPEHQTDEIIDQTYERYNRDSALIAAETLIEVKRDFSKQVQDELKSSKSSNSKSPSAPAFVYISADRAFPGIPNRYISTKREAELELYKLQPEIRPVIARPGFMYDPSESQSHNIRSKIKTLLDGVNAVNDRVFHNALDGIVRPTISTITVACWCLDRAKDPTFHGPILLDEMINVPKL